MSETPPYIAFPVPDGVDAEEWLSALDSARRFLEFELKAWGGYGDLRARADAVRAVIVQLRDSAAAIRDGLK